MNVQTPVFSSEPSLICHAGGRDCTSDICMELFAVTPGLCYVPFTMPQPIALILFLVQSLFNSVAHAARSVSPFLTLYVPIIAAYCITICCHRPASCRRPIICCKPQWVCSMTPTITSGMSARADAQHGHAAWGWVARRCFGATTATDSTQVMMASVGRCERWAVVGSTCASMLLASLVTPDNSSTCS